MSNAKRFCKVKSRWVEILPIPLNEATLSVCEITCKAGKADVTQCAHYCAYSYPFQFVASFALTSRQLNSDSTIPLATVIERGNGQVKDYTSKTGPHRKPPAPPTPPALPASSVSAPAQARPEPPSVEQLIEALKTQDPQARQGAIEALRDCGWPAVDPLIAALRYTDERTRAGAAEALGKIGVKRAIDPLAELARADPVTRRAAVAAVISIGDCASGEDRWPAYRLLKAMRDHPDERLVSEVARALVRWGYDYMSPKWPPYGRDLPAGLIGVGIDNSANEFSVRIGVRSAAGSLDFMADPRQRIMVRLDPGKYQIYFQYFNDPFLVYQGEDLTLGIDMIEIRLMQVSGGNYQVRKL
jgi:hypothetical protein